MPRYLVALVFTAIGFSVLGADEKVGESPYYPTKIGSTWTYRTANQKIVVRVAKHEKQGDLMCALVETVVNGQVAASEHIGITKEGIVRASYGGAVPERPLLFLKLTAKSGESWDIANKIGGMALTGKFTRGEEEVEVPGFKGKAVTSKGTFEAAGQNVSFHYWFAPGKGIVKLEMITGGQTVNMELESFQMGK